MVVILKSITAVSHLHLDLVINSINFAVLTVVLFKILILFLTLHLSKSGVQIENSVLAQLKSLTLNTSSFTQSGSPNAQSRTLSHCGVQFKASFSLRNH